MLWPRTNVISQRSRLMCAQSVCLRYAFYCWRVFEWYFTQSLLMTVAIRPIHWHQYLFILWFLSVYLFPSAYIYTIIVEDSRPYSFGHLVLSHLAHVCVLMLRPFSAELVMFPNFEFLTPLDTSILLKLKSYLRRCRKIFSHHSSDSLSYMCLFVWL